MCTCVCVCVCVCVSCQTICNSSIPAGACMPVETKTPPPMDAAVVKPADTGRTKDGQTTDTTLPKKVRRWLPGVCNGIGGIGVGCGYDITRLSTMGSSNINPIRPIVHLGRCPKRCYVEPPSSDYDCEDCTLVPVPPEYTGGVTYNYRLPENVLAKREPAHGSCFDAHNFSYVDDFQAAYYRKWTHHGFFHSHSKTIEHFYHQYFEQDNSLSVASFFDMYHSLTLAPISLVDSPNWEFRLAVAKLPLVYEGNALISHDHHCSVLFCNLFSWQATKEFTATSLWNTEHITSTRLVPIGCGCRHFA